MDSTSTNDSYDDLDALKYKYNNANNFAKYYHYRLEQAGIEFPIAALPMFAEKAKICVGREIRNVKEGKRLLIGFTVTHKLLSDVHNEHYIDHLRRPPSLRKLKVPKRGKLFPHKFWWIPPLYFDTFSGESGFLDGCAIFNFPKHPTQLLKDDCTIDDMYYFNSSRLAQYMLTLPNMDKVENMDYKTEAYAVHSKMLSEKLKELYKNSEHSLDVTRGIWTNRFNCLNYPLPTLLTESCRKAKNVRFFLLTRDEKALAVLVWCYYAGKIYIPYIRVISKKAYDDEIQPYLFHLILYEFCKRFPRDTPIIAAGSSSDPKALERFGVLVYENYKVVPSIPNAIFVGKHNNLRVNIADKLDFMDIKGYISENFIEPYITDLLRGRHASGKLGKLLRRLSKGLSVSGITKQFRRFAIKHNARIIAESYKKRTAKTHTHYVPQDASSKKYLVSKRYISIRKNREAIYGADKN